MDKKIEKIANTFKSYDEMYNDLVNHGLDSLPNQMEIGWMLEYFTRLGEYEKCSVLLDFKNKIKI